MPKTNQTARVLIVDDEPHLRELLVDALADDSLEIHCAASGAEAISLAGTMHPDLLVTDYLLGDCTGVDVIDQLRTSMADLPAVVITGHRDIKAFSEASQRRPVELMCKPLDIDRLRRTVADEVQRVRRERSRTRRLRRLVRDTNRQKKEISHKLETTCEDLTDAYRTLSGQLAFQQVVLNFQRQLLAAKTDDEVFGMLFRFFVQRSGPVYGVALVCDSEAELKMIGRFGVPTPDSAAFCERLTAPLIDKILADPTCQLLDAGEEAESFDESIRKYLVGLSALTVPLIPTPGEMIGLLVLYRKGEQPFTDGDVALAELIGVPTAVAVRRND